MKSISILPVVFLVLSLNLYAIEQENVTDYAGVQHSEEEEELPLDLTEVRADNDSAFFQYPEITLSNGIVIPAARLYNEVWRNDLVNPYNIRLVDTKDTLTLDMSGYVHPILNRVTSPFGLRRGRYHYGTDVKLQTGDSIKCSFDGMVRIALRGKGYGKFVVVRHYNGLETTYAHLSKISVNVNDTIKAGELIGLGGNTGRSTGPHLHYEMRYLGTPINPEEVIDFSTGQAKLLTTYITAANFEYIKDAEKIRHWTVRKGDTLGRISQKTGVSIAKICQLNGIKRSTLLRIGRKIRYN